MSGSFFRRHGCRLCNSTELEEVFSLRPTPPANAYITREALAVHEEKFPLDLFFCQSCAHLQILDVVDPEILFRDYVYVSGTSPVFVKHFKNYAESVSHRIGNLPQKSVLEIGSNDGTLLRFFKELGFSVLGVDPAKNIAQKATNEGIKTLPEFFTPSLATEIHKDFGSVDLVLANNVFAHIDDLGSIVEGVKHLLTADGLFVFEVSYLLDVYKNTLFDTIYHEHLSYHSVKPLQTFFESMGMELIDVESVSSHGGSLRGFAQKKRGAHLVSKNVEVFITQEASLGLHQAETFKKFAAKIDQLRDSFLSLVKDLKRQGHRLAGFGAPAKATTLMHHFGVGTDVVDYIVDDNPLKQGLFTPGLHVPIRSSAALYEDKPNYIVILAWNFAESIIAKNAELAEQGVKFILPLPELKII